MPCVDDRAGTVRDPMRRRPHLHGVRVLLFLWLCVSMAVLGAELPVGAARLYQWRSPHTGTTQLAGRPPIWYRSTVPGPRVLVFARGRLIDDTAQVVTEAERRALRAAAFGAPDPTRWGSTEPGAVSATQNMSAAAAISAVPAPRAADRRDAAEAERLKAIIADWERARSAAARSILSPAPDAPAAPIRD